MVKEKIILASKAHTKYLRISPRKVRQVIDLVRGEEVPKAFSILGSLNKRATRLVQKTLKSALSNAQQNPEVKADELFISKINADSGPTLKRFRAAAMGRATMIRHRTTHLFVELSKKEKSMPKPKKKNKVKKRK
ncbi:MAG: 50S ribosomal protein L22 [Candidatus Omnitrophica bacterium]|nr:50S ribosomal protein L22 [Candidatus Omnitrophota bacterium]